MHRPLYPFAILATTFLCFVPCSSARASRLPSGQTSPFPAIPRGGARPAAPATEFDSVEIPGPLRSFLRMAGISQEIDPGDVLALLSRNVALQGYSGASETEFLVLLRRYVSYARGLQALTDGTGTIRLSGCDDAGRLVDALGYRIERGCSDSGAYLVPASPERAFLTLDSGFPLTELEEAIQKHTSFTYPFPSTRVPVLFRERQWRSISSWKGSATGNLVDVLLEDRDLARLYWAMAKIDPETRLALSQSPGLGPLMPLAPALDLYGSQLRIRAGRVLVPGGSDAAKNWEELAEASPSSPGAFVKRVFSADEGWLAAWFDALSQVSLAEQVHLTDSNRLKFLFHVYHLGAANTTATRGTYPSNGELLILLSNLRWAPNGEVFIPGNLGLWKYILIQKTRSTLIRDWVRHARSWDSSDQLLGTLIALTHASEDGPLKIYLMLNGIDRERPEAQPLSDPTLRLLADKYSAFHAWYSVFVEFPALNDESVARFLSAAEGINGISDMALRSNALGAFQADIGIWEILARQGEIPDGQLNSSWQQALQSFTDVSSSTRLFEATRASLGTLMLTATGSNTISEERLVDVLAGPQQQSAAGQEVHQLVAARIRAVLDDQRLVSLDTLLGLYDGLGEMAHGTASSDELLPLAESLREFEVPRQILTNGERIGYVPQIYTSRHAELQVKTDLTREIRTPHSPAQLEAARGQLTPFLRDTLVGLNYAYYEPPGAQVLHHNPLFVRSHDFSAGSVQGLSDIWGAPQLMGIGVTAGGGAYLIGSLAGLPYALAAAEENFISPTNVQALIWEEAVPSLLVDAVVPRWWGVSAAEMHAATLYQRAGEEILKDAGSNAQVRDEAIAILSDRLSSKRLAAVEDALQSPAGAAALVPQMFPSELFELAAEFRQKHPAEAAGWGPENRELDELTQKAPNETSVERLSRDFGVPHPTLDQSDVRMLVNARPFPAQGGDASGLFGESWQSNALYWARLADEMGYAPVMLDLLVPALTQRMVANIFATDIEDRAALLRAMQQTGEEFRTGQIKVANSGTIDLPRDTAGR